MMKTKKTNKPRVPIQCPDCRKQFGFSNREAESEVTCSCGKSFKTKNGRITSIDSLSFEEWKIQYPNTKIYIDASAKQKTKEKNKKESKVEKTKKEPKIEKTKRNTYHVEIDCPDCTSTFTFPISDCRVEQKCTCGTYLLVKNGQAKEINGELINPPDPEKKPSFFSKHKIKLLLTNLICVIIFLCFQLKNATQERRQQNTFTQQIFNDILSDKNGGYQAIKKHLTEDSKALFELFIESNYTNNHVSSIEKINRFFQTLKPLDYNTQRTFMFQDSNGNSHHIKASYIWDKNNEKYLIDVDIKEFMK